MATRRQPRPSSTCSHRCTGGLPAVLAPSAVPSCRASLGASANGAPLLPPSAPLPACSKKPASSRARSSVGQCLWASNAAWKRSAPAA
jgi:hypothetical protein